MDHAVCISPDPERVGVESGWIADGYTQRGQGSPRKKETPNRKAGVTILTAWGFSAVE